MTSTTTPAVSDGVAAPHAGVYSVVCPATGLSLRSSWRRWPVPRQVPSNATGATVSVPSEAMTRLERDEIGAASSAPLRMTIPVGGPLPVKKSPFTPTTVAAALASFSIPVSGSVPKSDAVRECRAEGVERAVRLRRGHDVEDDRASRCELHLALVGHPRHKQLLRDDLLRGRAARGIGRHGERARDGNENEELAKHDPVAG